MCEYFIWFMLYSVIGWIYESVYCSIQQRRPVNRGFLNGPLCPIYGAGAAAFGAMSVLLIRCIHPLVAMLTGQIPPRLLAAAAGLLLALLLADTAITAVRLLQLNKKLKQVHEHVSAIAGESRLRAEEMKRSVEEGIASIKINGIAPQMRGLLQKITKRDRTMFQSFPKFQSTRYGDIVDKLKEVLKGNR